MTEITREEEGIVGMVRLNKALPKLGTRQEWKFSRFRFIYTCGSARSLWGRFGGGWNWKLGVAIGGSTVILDCLVCSLRIDLLAARKGEK